MKKNSMFKKLIAAGICSMALLTGCGGSAGYDASYSGNGAYYTEPMASADEYKCDDYDYGYFDDYAIADMEMVVNGGESGSTRVGDSGATTPQTADPTRKLITTATVDVETKEFDKLYNDIESYVKNAGGYLESINTYNGSRYHGQVVERHANLTVRIPAQSLDAFIEEIGNAGNITNRSQNVEDITLTYVDLEAHKKTLMDEQARLEEFLREAETIEDMIYIEDRLANIRYQLESMESQLRTYDNKVNYSTIYLNIDEVIEYTPVVYEEPTTWERMKEGFSDSLEDIWDGIQNFAVWFVSNVIYLIIFAVIIFAIVRWIIYMASDKRAAKKAAKLAKKQKAQYDAYQNTMNTLSNVDTVTAQSPAQAETPAENKENK
ncbi:MAG: DUF4349 domain-containing protein [Lachnospiraceae bacterium]|nr:DUF4349 domain-containing protein [Lachnospiraceae bacterium]